jgi:hypothetical protein
MDRARCSRRLQVFTISPGHCTFLLDDYEEAGEDGEARRRARRQTLALPLAGVPRGAGAACSSSTRREPWQTHSGEEGKEVSRRRSWLLSRTPRRAQQGRQGRTHLQHCRSLLYQVRSRPGSWGIGGDAREGNSWKFDTCSGVVRGRHYPHLTSRKAEPQHDLAGLPPGTSDAILSS